MIVTIDGPAGSGKSTAARLLATRLGIAHLDTGAMYRAVALQLLHDGVSMDDAKDMLAAAGRLDIQMESGVDGARVFVNRVEVTDAIRTLPVSKATSVIARVQPIRDLLVAKQRDAGRRLGSFVTEGRDQGSVVFPNADVRFVLEASPICRARRRLADLGGERSGVTLDDVLRHITERDATDRIQWESLLAPGAAIIIDTTELTTEQVVDALERHVRRTVNPLGDKG